MITCTKIIKFISYNYIDMRNDDLYLFRPKCFSDCCSSSNTTTASAKIYRQIVYSAYENIVSVYKAAFTRATFCSENRHFAFFLFQIEKERNKSNGGRNKAKCRFSQQKVARVNAA